MNTLNQALYGAVDEPNLIRTMAAIMNVALMAYFTYRSGFNERTAIIITLYAFVTLIAWKIFPSSVGISSIWCALYGALKTRNSLDDGIFWSHLLTILAFPSLTEEWGPNFYYMANAAHVLSASSAFVIFNN